MKVNGCRQLSGYKHLKISSFVEERNSYRFGTTSFHT